MYILNLHNVVYQLYLIKERKNSLIPINLFLLFISFVYVHSSPKISSKRYSAYCLSQGAVEGKKSNLTKLFAMADPIIRNESKRISSVQNGIIFFTFLYHTI